MTPSSGDRRKTQLKAVKPTSVQVKWCNSTFSLLIAHMFER